MDFTLVTTCYNEISSLAAWRQDLASQTRQPDEITIVDGGSTDGTVEKLQKWATTEPRLKVYIEKCNVARGRNIAIEMATHEYIVSTDMGVRLDRKWFEEIVRPVEEDPTVDVVAGSYAVDKSTITTPAARAEYYIEGDGIPRLEPGFVVGNRSVVYKKTVWRELGGLPEGLTMCADDCVFGSQILQADYKMAFAPNAMVYWARPRKLKEFWKEKFRYGRGGGEALIGNPIAFRLYKRGLSPRCLVPVISGFRTLTRQLTLRRIFTAIHKRDFIACLYMPILLFGNGYYHGKGYLIGNKWGEKHCQECRSRLKATMPSRTTANTG